MTDIGLIQALRLHCEAGKKIGLSGAIWTLLGDASTALKSMTAQLAALQAENAQLKRRLGEMNDFEKSQCAKLLEKLSRVETERDAAVAGLHSMHTLCMEIGESCPECGRQIDDLLDSACTFCKGSGVSCWKIDPENKNRCAAFEWRGAQGEGRA